TRRRALIRWKPVGYLLDGVWSDKKPWITHAIEVSGAHRRSRRYVLPEGRTHAAVAELRKVDSRIGYLGDWHSHPAPCGPSRIDRETMAKFTKDGHTLVLVIARCGRRGY